MNGVPIAPRRVFGVHLAGWTPERAEIWVCRAHPGSDGIRIEGIEPLIELPGGAREPDAAAAVIVTKIREAPRSAWGFDVPFVAPDTAADESPGGDWLRTRILDPVGRLPSACRLPLDPLPVVTPEMPAAMAATAANTYLLQVCPQALRARLQEESVRLPPLHDDDWRQALRDLAAANLARPMARTWRQRVVEQPGARAALLCAIATWRGYRGHDHRRLHAERAGTGFAYC